MIHQALIHGGSDADGEQNLPLYQFLDTIGDGSGTTNAILDFNATPDIWRIAPPAGSIYRLARLIICIEDGQGFRAGHYGSLGAALANGITVRTHDGDNVLVPLDGSLPVKTNAQWGSLCYDVDLKEWGAGNELLLVRWTFRRAGQYLRLDGDANEELQVLFSDDLTGLVTHRYFVQGYTEYLAT